MLKSKVYKELMEQFQKDDVIYEILKDTINSMVDYLKIVTQMETTMRMLRFRLEPEDFRLQVEEMDNRRRRIHNAVICNVKAVNRICRKESLPLFYEGDEGDRYAVADFTGELINEIYINRVQ